MSEETTIRRGARNARYTAVPNHVFEDMRLSMEARWLLGYLLSKPDHWTVRMGDIRKKGMCGRDKARAMISELVDAGYITREDARKDGKFNGLALVIYDEPQRPETPADGTVASLPQTEKPATVEPAPANPPLVKTDNLETPESRKDPLPSPRGEARGEETKADRRKIEEQFWKVFAAWPHFSTASKPKAIRAWTGLSADDRERAAEAVPRYLGKVADTKRYAVSMASYLRQPDLWLSPAEPDKPRTKLMARPWGPAWGQLVMLALLAGPVDPGPVTMTRQARAQNFRAMCEMLGPERAAAHYRRLGHDIAADGSLVFPDDFEARMEREHLAAHGWPAVNRLYEAARQGQALPLPDDHRTVDCMEAVPVGLRVWGEWRDHFERKGWLWLPDPGKQPVVFFPAGGPEGLGAFEAAAKTITEGARDDAGRSEAA